MTATDLLRQRTLAAISEAADDYGVEHLTGLTQLRGDLGLSASQRLALFFELCREFGTELDAEAERAITNIDATVEAVCLAVVRNVTTGVL